MRRAQSAALVATLLCGLALASVALAGGMFSDNYGVPWDARYGGGGLSSSDNYAVNGTVGQGAIGWTASANYGVGAGYWYGVGAGYRICLPLVMKGFP
jgi:hypothetical protein